MGKHNQPEPMIDRTTVGRYVDAAKLRHKSLLGVYEMTSGMRQQDQSALLASLELGEYFPTQFRTDDKDEAYWEKGTQESFGGGAMVVRHKQTECFRTLVTLDPFEHQYIENEWLRACVQTAHLFHELGHVDDFEKQRNIVLGRTLDFVAIELYAHHHACKRLISNRLKMAMAYYLHMLIRTLRNGSGPTKDAADAFAAQPIYGEYVRFAGDHLTALTQSE